MADSYAALPAWAKHLYTQTKWRAHARGTEFLLTKDEWVARVTDRCELTGIPFEIGTRTSAAKHYKRPYAPSIDRRDNSLGYTAENIRVVCTCVNLAMNVWGEEVLLKMAAGLMLKQYDASAWRKAAGKLPEGVKLHHVTSRGPLFVARARIGSERKYLGCFRSAEDAEDAIEIAKREADISLDHPWEESQKTSEADKSLQFNELSTSVSGRRDWTRTHPRRKA